MAMLSHSNKDAKNQDTWLVVFILLFFTLLSLVLFMIDCLIKIVNFTNGFYILICVAIIIIHANKRSIIYITALITFLMIAGYFIHHGYVFNQDAFLRRVVLVAVAWTVAWLGFFNIRIQEEANLLEQRFQIIFESTPNALILVNQDTRIIIANNQAKKMFLYPQHTLVGLKINSLIPARFHSSHHQGVQGYLNKPETRRMGVGRDLKGLRSDGTEFPVEIGLNPLYINNTLYILASIIDITDRKKLDEIRDHFSGILAHELRTPLAVVSGIIDNLNDGMEGPVSESQKQIIGIAKDNLDSLHDIINHLLMMRRFDKGNYKVKLQKNDLVQLLKRIGLGFFRLGQAQDLNVIVDVPEALPAVICDMALLKEVIYNLFSNALRHAQKSIVLKACVMQNDTSKVCITMHDDGPGMSEKSMKEIFHQPTQKMHLSVNEHDGLGLGLPLCIEMMASQNGKIWVENQNGCSIHLAFPIA
ncbi:PAS domain-containing sensor histidine kinase [bacterium]|nr:PAS domain-containing sensor histidine kinase [bacterium]